MGNQWRYGAARSTDIVLRHPVMLTQQGHKQTGQVDVSRPGATHTRFDHGGNTADVTDDICDVLESRGILPDRRADIVNFAKIHDGGHYPLSHAIEYLMIDLLGGKDHKHMLLDLLDAPIRDSRGRTLADALQDSFSDVDNIRSMIDGSNPSGLIVSDKTLGADKLAYTNMDAERCDHYQRPPDYKRLLQYLTFVDSIGIDIGITEDHIDHPLSMVCDIQRFYFRMYNDVYLSVLSLAAERHVQKAVEFAIRGGLFQAEEVWRMTDGGLMDKINGADSSVDEFRLAQMYLSGYTSRSPYVPIAALKYDVGLLDRLSGEQILGIDEGFGTQFVEIFKDPTKLTELESELELELGIPVLVSVLPDPEKVNPTPVVLYRDGRRVSLLEDKGARPDHYRELREGVRSSFAIRLLVPPQERDEMLRHREDAAQELVSKAKEYLHAA